MYSLSKRESSSTQARNWVYMSSWTSRQLCQSMLLNWVVLSIELQQPCIIYADHVSLVFFLSLLICSNFFLFIDDIRFRLSVPSCVGSIDRVFTVHTFSSFHVTSLDLGFQGLSQRPAHTSSLHWSPYYVQTSLVQLAREIKSHIHTPPSYVNDSVAFLRK